MSHDKYISRTFKFESLDTDMKDGLSVNIPEVVDVKYGLFVWPCAPLLAQYVYHRRQHIAGKRILELGCGTSLPGIVAAKLSAVVTLSDSEHLPFCLERAKASCLANGLHNVAVTSITWGLCSPQLLSLSQIDIILGSDCFYDVNDFEPIIATVAYILRKNPAAEFWTTYQVRSASRSIDHLLHKWDLKGRPVRLADFTELSRVIVCNSNKLLQFESQSYELFIITRQVS